MGVGGSLLMPSTLSMLFTVFRRRSSARRWPAGGRCSMLGAIGGPTVGGVLLEHFWWGSVFLLNVPIAVLGDRRRAGDHPRVARTGPGRRSCRCGAVDDRHDGPRLGDHLHPGQRAGSSRVLGGLAVGVVSLAAFALWERRSAHPMLPLQLFRDRNFSGTSLSIVLLSFSAGGLLLALTQYLQFVLATAR